MAPVVPPMRQGFGLAMLPRGGLKPGADERRVSMQNSWERAEQHEWARMLLKVRDALLLMPGVTEEKVIEIFENTAAHMRRKLRARYTLH